MIGTLYMCPAVNHDNNGIVERVPPVRSARLVACLAILCGHYELGLDAGTALPVAARSPN